MEQNWKGKKILIADDSEINYILLKKNIEDSGAEILWAKDGRQLIDIVENQKDIDLVLLDISMPKIDGLTATKMLREAGFETPIIAQSSFISENEIDKVLEAGCNNYITKPFQKLDLFAKMEALLQ
jgi:two-component system, cell cycle response regulator DivK